MRMRKKHVFVVITYVPFVFKAALRFRQDTLKFSTLNVRQTPEELGLFLHQSTRGIKQNGFVSV